MQNNLSTGRLTLALLTKEDYEFIIQLVNTKGWLEFIGDRKIHSKEAAIAYINKISDAQHIYYWIASLKDGNIPIGIVSFLKREYLENFDIGFAFLPEYNGHGYAYEATSEILSMVSSYSLYNTVLATTMPNNISSIKLLTRLGFHFEKEVEAGTEKLHVYSHSKHSGSQPGNR